MTQPIKAHQKASTIAVLLDKSTRWVRDKVKDGEFEGYRAGSEIIVSVDSVNRWLAAHNMQKPDITGHQ